MGGVVTAYTGLLNLLHGEVGQVMWEPVEVPLRGGSRADHYKARWRGVEVRVHRDRVVFRGVPTEAMQEDFAREAREITAMLSNGTSTLEETARALLEVHRKQGLRRQVSRSVVEAWVGKLPTELADKVRAIWLEVSVHQRSVVDLWALVRES